MYIYIDMYVYICMYIYKIATNSCAARRLSEETAKMATKFSRNRTIENDYIICS